MYTIKGIQIRRDLHGKFDKIRFELWADIKMDLKKVLRVQTGIMWLGIG
jgi:hypothetical protein